MVICTECKNETTMKKSQEKEIISTYYGKASNTTYTTYNLLTYLNYTCISCGRVEKIADKNDNLCHTYNEEKEGKVNYSVGMQIPV